MIEGCDIIIHLPIFKFEIYFTLQKTVANGKPVPKLKKLPIDPESLERHSRGVGLEGKGIKTKHHAIKLKRKEKLIANAQEEAAHAEILLTESAGY